MARLHVMETDVYSVYTGYTEVLGAGYRHDPTWDIVRPSCFLRMHEKHTKDTQHKSQTTSSSHVKLNTRKMHGGGKSRICLNVLCPSSKKPSLQERWRKSTLKGRIAFYGGNLRGCL
ncbi:hypothetical protein MGYG_00176 [Nannizzia gypsea CBS 118893]|uniref:Uncharacterized protein n=1 Tax=Arthroderma gypseum (strain ATCC MYA-4604 / CBS 118893) TaxID=535722 RepID=E5R3K9_ARTGP|nr:hypothetical protein MGYG_00176 [Nannizzia gypsea CBS 118893]EFQ97133.1 hypothetical protein MGYG_00176 [Nannizzia gypsea CBS 118893]